MSSAAPHQKARRPLRLPLHRWVVILGFLAGLLSLPGTIRLYSHLKTDFEELLPENAPALLQLEEITQRIESTEHLAILIQGKSQREVEDFSKKLEYQLSTRKKDSPIASVRSGVFNPTFKNQERKNLGRLALLSLSEDQLLRFESSLREKLDYEKKLYNPLNIFSGIDLEEPKILDLGRELRAMADQHSLPGDSEGNFALADGKTRAILVGLRGKSSGIDAIAELKKAVNFEIERLLAKKKSDAGPIQIHFTGGVQNTWEEHEGIIEDLGTSSWMVVVLVLLSLLLFLRKARVVFALCVSLMLAILWTFGTASLWVDALNSNSAFLGSIIVGNGINFGIIVCARFLELSKNPNSRLGLDDQIRQAIRDTWRPTLLAAAAAGIAYGSLLNTHFRGFRQFGGIGLVGMIYSWISAVIVLPSILNGFQSHRRPGERSERQSHSPSTPQPIRRPSQNPKKKIQAWAILSLSVLSASLSLYAIQKTPFERLLETDLSRLRSANSFENGSGFWSKTLDQILGRPLSPVAVLTSSPEKAELIAKALRNSPNQTQSKSPLFSAVRTLQSFLPGTPREIERKQKILKRVHQLFPPWRFVRLKSSDQERLAPILDRELLKPWSDQRGFSWLPESAQSLFRERDGKVGRIVWLDPPRGSEHFSPHQLNDWVNHINTITSDIDPNSLLAGTLPLTRDLIFSIETDGPKSARTAAFGVALLIALLAIRSPRRGFLTACTLGLGVLWLGGWIVLSGIRLHFLNFLAIPITIGIGVDYGINLLERLEQRPASKGLSTLAPSSESIRATRNAVILCSLTTLIGYGSLLGADNQALRSFGWICVAGELTCILAATITLPAIWALFFESRGKPGRLKAMDQQRAGPRPQRRAFPRWHRRRSGD